MIEKLKEMRIRRHQLEAKMRGCILIDEEQYNKFEWYQTIIIFLFLIIGLLIMWLLGFIDGIQFVGWLAKL